MSVKSDTSENGMVITMTPTRRRKDRSEFEEKLWFTPVIIRFPCSIDGHRTIPNFLNINIKTSRKRMQC